MNDDVIPFLPPREPKECGCIFGGDAIVICAVHWRKVSKLLEEAGVPDAVLLAIQSGDQDLINETLERWEF